MFQFYPSTINRDENGEGIVYTYKFQFYPSTINSGASECFQPSE